MREILDSKLKEKGFLIAQHRGTFGANVLDNTYLSMKLALEMGADMVEVDVIKSSDGILYAFHRGKELKKFKKDFDITSLTSKEIEKLEYENLEGGDSGRGVEKLEDILIKLKGDYLINLDRAWDYLPEAFELVKKLGMEKQIIVKSAPSEKVLTFLKNSDIKLMFMPIIRKAEDIDQFIDENINLVAVEVLFDSENNELNSKEFKEKLKKHNILLWINAIKLDHTPKFNFAAGHSDDSALENDGEGWKWIIDAGANIIQTDWCYFLNRYRNKVNKLSK